MTTVRAAAASVPFTPVLDFKAQPGQLRPYVKEDSPDAALLRGMLASAGVSTEGRSLADAVREFQTSYNASGAGSIGVDGKAGSETLGALRTQLASTGGRDLAISGDGRFAQFMGEGLDYSAAQGSSAPRDALSGAQLATMMQSARGNQAAVRNLLDAKLDARDSEQGGAATGEIARRGVNAAGLGKPVRFEAPIGRDGIEAALNEARVSGRAQQVDLNGTRVVVQPTDTLAKAGARYDAMRKLPPMSFQSPVGKDAFEGAAREAERTGRAQTWRHAPGVDATVRPGESASRAFERFNADASQARLARGIAEKSAMRADVTFRAAFNESLRAQGVSDALKPGETVAQLEARVADRGAIKRAMGAADEAMAAVPTPARAAPARAAIVEALPEAASLGKVASTGARVLGKVAVPLGLAVDALDIGRAVERDTARADGRHVETTRAVGRAAGGWGGAALGATAGAAVGSVVPVIGTAIGAVVGGVLGGLGGSELGEAVAS